MTTSSTPPDFHSSMPFVMPLACETSGKIRKIHSKAPESPTKHTNPPKAAYTTAPDGKSAYARVYAIPGAVKPSTGCPSPETRLGTRASEDRSLRFGIEWTNG